MNTVAHGDLRAEYDPDADALYVYLSDQPYSHGRDLDDARRIDYSSDGSPIGVEVLSPRAIGVNLSGLPREDELAAIVRELGFQVTQPAA